MKLKYIIYFCIILCIFPWVASAESVVYGNSGILFHNNITLDNSVINPNDGTIENDLIADDYKYRFDGGIKNWNQNIENDGVLYDNAYWGDWLVLDGAADYMKVSDADSLSFSNNMTVIINATINSSGDFLFYKGSTATNREYSMISSENDIYTFSTFALGSGTGYASVTSSHSSSTVFNTVIATRNGTQQKIYYNKFLQDTDNYANNIGNGASDLYIGTYGGDIPTYSVKSNISSFLLYDYEFTQSSVNQSVDNIYKSTSNSTTPITDLGEGNQSSSVSYNGSGDAYDIYINSSALNDSTWTNWILLKANASSKVNHTITTDKMRYIQIRFKSNLTNYNQTSDISAIVINSEQNYVTSNVTYCDGTNSTIVCIFNVSYVSPGTTQWGFNFSWTNNGQQYDWTYTNGTIIQSLTASSTNETLEFMQPTLPTGIYYIQKSSVTIETFVVAAGAFAAVVVAGAAVVSRRVRRGISGFWNRRIRRR